MLQCPRGPFNGKKSIGGIDTKIIAISVAIHLVILLLALLAGAGSKAKLEFVVYGAYSKQPCQVLFKPMNSAGKNGNGGKTTDLKAASKLVAKKEAKKAKLSKKAKKEVALKKKEKRVPNPKLLANTKQQETKAVGPTIKDLEAEEAALLAKIKISKKKKHKKEQEVKDLQKKEKELKALQKKEQELKALELEEERLKKEIVKNKEEEKKKEQQKKEEEKKAEEEAEAAEATEESEEVVQSSEDDALEFTVQNEMHGIPHYNLMGDADPRRIAMQNAVQEAISNVWSPPVGVTKGTQARVFFKVDEMGNIVEFEIEEASGIVIFDTSIMRSAADIKFPKTVWGRGFPITYQQ